MVIFGKKARDLIKRVKELEHTKELQGNENIAIGNKLDKLEAALKELMLTVENSLDNGEPRKTPQQLLKEWFLGDDKDGGQ